MRKQLLNRLPRAALVLLLIPGATFALRGLSPWLEGLCDRALILEPVGRALLVLADVWDWRAL